MTDPNPNPIDDLAAAEDAAAVVDQQTAAEAGIDGAGSKSDADESETQAHPTGGQFNPCCNCEAG